MVNDRPEFVRRAGCKIYDPRAEITGGLQILAIGLPPLVGCIGKQPAQSELEPCFDGLSLPQVDKASVQLVTR